MKASSVSSALIRSESCRSDVCVVLCFALGHLLFDPAHRAAVVLLLALRLVGDLHGAHIVSLEGARRLRRDSSDGEWLCWVLRHCCCGIARRAAAQDSDNALAL